MQAILDNVIVKPCDSDEISEMGIIVPENARERSNKAIIVSYGDKAKKSFSLLNIGAICFHIKGAGKEVVENGVNYFIIKAQDILAFSPQN